MKEDMVKGEKRAEPEKSTKQLKSKKDTPASK